MTGRIVLTDGYIRMRLSRRPPVYALRRTIDYVDRRSMLFAFNEIFVDDDYRFATDSKAPVIVDGGSNIGLSVLYFKQLYPAAQILAVEPEPASFASLQRNVAVNQLADVTVVQAALTDHDGTARIGGDPGSLTAAIRDDGVEVPARRLSTLIEGPVDFLKLDVQGAEGAVLRDLADTGKLELVDQMVVEYHHDGGSDLAATLGLLQEHGFGYKLAATRERRWDRDRALQDVLVYAYR